MRNNMEDWDNMVVFAVKLINHGITHKKIGSILSQRIAIIHLDNATELLMKSYLIREGLFVNYLTDKMYFPNALKGVKEKLELDEELVKKFTEFHELRNKIQHKPLKIKLNKMEKIKRFVPSLIDLYEKMFPDEWEWWNIQKDGKIKRSKVYKRKIKTR